MSDRNIFGVPKRKPTIQLFAQVVTQCDCGNTEPMVLLVIPGAKPGSQCNKCGTTWYIREFAYEGNLQDPQAFAQCEVIFHKEVPSIIRPVTTS